MHLAITGRMWTFNDNSCLCVVFVCVRDFFFTCELYKRSKGNMLVGNQWRIKTFWESNHHCSLVRIKN